MILRSIRTEGHGCFADPVAVGPFEPGINIVHAPNGTGKTTLFRALALASIEAHRSKAADIQALRPWGRRLSPCVTIEFEHAGRIYRLRKHFLDGASAHLETKDGEKWTAFAQGDSADEFVRGLLRIGTDKARAAKPEHWGIGQILWTTQGDLSLPGLAPNVVDYIRSSVGAQLTGRGSTTEAAIEREYLKYFSPTAARLKTGKGAAPQVKLAAERARLLGEQQTAEDLLRQFEAESTLIEQLHNEAGTLTAERIKLAAELAFWRDSVGTYDRLTSERGQKSAHRDEANSRQKGLRERIATIEGCRRQLGDLETQLGTVVAALPGARSRREIAAATVQGAELDLSDVVRAEVEALRALAEGQLAQEYVRALDQHREFDQRLADIALSESRLREAAEQLRAIVAPLDSEIGVLREALERSLDVQRKLDLARVSAEFTPERSIQIEVLDGEKPGALSCEPNQLVHLAGSPNLAFHIAGIGRIDIAGPATDYPSLRQASELFAADVATFTDRFETSDVNILEERRRQKVNRVAIIQEENRAISTLLAGNTVQFLLEQRAATRNRIDEIERVNPEWKTSPPDDVALTNEANGASALSRLKRDMVVAALDRARAELSALDAELNGLEATRIAHEGHREAAKELLSNGLTDGLGEQDRRKALEQAVLDFDRYQLALDAINRELEHFSEDPRAAVERLTPALARSEQAAREADQSLLKARTRIETLAERKPYAALAEVSEQLALATDRLNREDLRMKAIKLLHEALSEAKKSVILNIAQPVEKTASEFLEEICGKPLAQIRFTQELTPEQVIPAQLAGETDSAVTLERLSGGEREQVFLCTRLALAAELARNERQMVVLDDVLTFTDPERLQRISSLIERLSDRLQIVILTCHPQRFAAMAGAKRIDLRLLLTGLHKAAA